MVGIQEGHLWSSSCRTEYFLELEKKVPRHSADYIRLVVNQNEDRNTTFQCVLVTRSGSRYLLFKALLPVVVLQLALKTMAEKN